MELFSHSVMILINLHLGFDLNLNCHPSLILSKNSQFIYGNQRLFTFLLLSVFITHGDC